MLAIIVQLVAAILPLIPEAVTAIEDVIAAFKSGNGPALDDATLATMAALDAQLKASAKQ